MDDAYRHGRGLHAAGFLRRNPDATPLDIHVDWIRQTLGEKFVRLFPKEGIVISLSPEQTRVVQEVIDALNKLNIPYAIGGSTASSFHGIRRNSEDADIAVMPFPGREAEFAACFGPEWYADVPMIQDAVRHRSSFNLIHWATGFKIDVFIQKGRPFDLSMMARRQKSATETDPAKPFDVVTAEDIVLMKLEWFRLGDEVSDRQWSDVLGVLRTQGERIDNAYLDHWAKELGVFDLLEKIREQV
jgi:hypothetical protein